MSSESESEMSSSNESGSGSNSESFSDSEQSSSKSRSESSATKRDERPASPPVKEPEKAKGEEADPTANFPTHVRTCVVALNKFSPDWRAVKHESLNGSLTIERSTRTFTSFSGMKGVLLKMFVVASGTVSKPYEFRLMSTKKGLHEYYIAGESSIAKESAMGESKHLFNLYEKLIESFETAAAETTPATYSKTFTPVFNFGKQVAKKPGASKTRHPDDTEDLEKELRDAKNLKNDPFINDDSEDYTGTIGSSECISSASDDTDDDDYQSSSSSEDRHRHKSKSKKRQRSSSSSSSSSSSYSSSSSSSESSESSDAHRSSKKNKKGDSAAELARLKKQLAELKKSKDKSKSRSRSSSSHKKHRRH